MTKDIERDKGGAEVLTHWFSLSYSCHCERFCSLLVSLALIFITFLRMIHRNTRDNNANLTGRVRLAELEVSDVVVVSHLWLCESFFSQLNTLDTLEALLS